MNKHKVYGIIFLVAIAAIIIGGVYYWQYGGSKQITDNSKQTQNSVDATTSWKTYTNTEFGFQFKMPPQYWFNDNMILNGSFSAETEALNKGLDSNKVKDNLNLYISPYVKAPKKPCPSSTSIVECQISQEEIKIISSKINSAKVGDSLDSLNDSGYFSYLYQPGEIIQLDGLKAFFQVNPDIEAKAFHITLYWVDKNNNLFELFESTPGDTLEQAKASTETQIFKQILSTFKFTSSDTVDWKTYTNDQYGFEFKYPSGYNYRGQDKNNLQIYPANWPDNLNGLFELILMPNPHQSNIASFYIEEYKNNEMGSKNPFFEDNGTVLKSTSTEKLLSGETVYVVKNAYCVLKCDLATWAKNEMVYLFKNSHVDYPDQDSIYQRILSTFKFTNQDATAGWKTYTDSSGYSIQYPNGWVFSSSNGTGDTKSEVYILEKAQSDANRYWSGFQIQVLKSGVNLDLSDYKRQTLNGYEAYYKDTGQQGGAINNSGSYGYVVKNDNTYILIGELFKEPSDLTVLNKILSTFKFTK